MFGVTAAAGLLGPEPNTSVTAPMGGAEKIPITPDAQPAPLSPPEGVPPIEDVYVRVYQMQQRMLQLAAAHAPALQYPFFELS